MHKMVGIIFLASVVVGPTSSFGDDKKTTQTTTTQEAAEAKKREGQTGTSNKEAAKQLEQMDKLERQQTTGKPPK